MAQLKVQKVPDVADRTLPIFAEFDKLAESIRVEAYKLFARRGAGDGHAMDDWLMAEREVCWPSAELAEQKGEYRLKVALAGFEPLEINVTATPREIFIKAAHKQEKASTGKDESSICWSEFESNDVYRRIPLPGPVDVEKISANFTNGLLEIAAPQTRAPIKHPVQIHVSAG